MVIFLIAMSKERALQKSLKGLAIKPMKDRSANDRRG